MSTILLHIGRHKSGTTALQNAFYSNREALAAAGVTYPLQGLRFVAHHPVAEAVHLHANRQSDFMHDALIREFRAEIDHAQTPWILVSSEGFQRCQPTDVERLFSDHRVKVIVYLRDQISYLQSAYLQEVHADAFQGTIEEFAATHYDADYENFLASWAQVFGEAQVLVRIFTAEHLRDGDVVRDFLSDVLPSMVGSSIPYNLPPDSAASRNPSLSGPWVPFKLRLNQVLPAEQCRFVPLYNALGRLNVARTDKEQLVPPALAGRMRAKYGRSNSRLLRKMGYPPNALEGKICPASQAMPLGPEDFHAALMHLIAEEPRCDFLREECYHAQHATTRFYHALTLSPHLLRDHLPLLRVVRQDQRIPFHRYFRPAGPSYVAALEHFDPSGDRLVAAIGENKLVPITLRPSPHPVWASRHQA